MTTIEAFRERRRLPVLAVVQRSYGYVWEHRAIFALPILVLAAILVAVSFLTYQPDATGAHDELSLGFGMLVGLVLKLVVTIAFAVGLHRTVLLDEAQSGLRFFRLDGNFLRYLGTSLLLFLIWMVYAVGAGFTIGLAAVAVAAVAGKLPVVAILGGLAAGIVYILVTVRFLSLQLALPAAALGQPERIATAWRAGAGNSFRLLATFILACMPFMILILIVGMPYFVDIVTAVANHTPQPRPGTVATIALALINAASIPVLLTGLSLSYDVLVRGGGPAPEPA
jgi:hypothetical protein